MFGKRKPGGGAPEYSEAAGRREPQTTVTRSSRPDASAVLDRQPAPPVAPVRRPVEAAAGARRGGDKREESEGKKLTVGPGIKLAGEITACEKLLVEGQVEADLADAQMLEIAEGGLFRGRASVDFADISGTFEGVLTVRQRLSLRGSGRIDGEVHYAEIEIERGGRLCGQVRDLQAGGETVAPMAAAAPAPEAPSPQAPAVEPAPAPAAGQAG